MLNDKPSTARTTVSSLANQVCSWLTSSKVGFALIGGPLPSQLKLA
jgi:hypothetical protein